MPTPLPPLTYVAPYTLPQARWRPRPWRSHDHPITELDLAVRHQWGETLTAWCVDNGFVEADEAGRLTIPNDTDAGVLAYHIYNTNFRTLNRADELARFLKALTGDELRTTDRLLNFVLRVQSEFAPAFLDAQLNQIYQSLHALSVPGDLDWALVHQRCPWLWVVIALHHTLHRHVIPHQFTRG